ncbi:MAG: ATP-dependent DNA helicase RecG, partial [Verrucomicrobia bacterium]|nr:ATP-dependent DNA helicase RecG [Verrucomicrobiota bacterium]
ISEARSAEARQRLRILEGTHDGFEIAEADLALRGPGELLGREQSGLPDFHFGNLARDAALVRRARELAIRMADDLPQAVAAPARR